MNDVFWFDNPLILFDNEYIFQIFPSRYYSFEKKLNALTRLVILLGTIIIILKRDINFLVVMLLILFGIVFLYKNRQFKTEGMKNNKKSPLVKSDFFKLESDNYTQPNKTNPLMNVLLPEIVDNPKRPPAAPAFEPQIEKNINNSIMDPRYFLDLGDNLSFDRSMRNFYAMPNTQVPNNQKKFAEFCYGNMPSCKEGNEFQCTKKNQRHRLI